MEKTIYWHNHIKSTVQEVKEPPEDDGTPTGHPDRFCESLQRAWDRKKMTNEPVTLLDTREEIITAINAWWNMLQSGDDSYKKCAGSMLEEDMTLKLICGPTHKNSREIKTFALEALKMKEKHEHVLSTFEKELARVEPEAEYYIAKAISEVYANIKDGSEEYNECVCILARIVSNNKNNNETLRCVTNFFKSVLEKPNDRFHRAEIDLALVLLQTEASGDAQEIMRKISNGDEDAGYINKVAPKLNEILGLKITKKKVKEKKKVTKESISKGTEHLKKYIAVNSPEMFRHHKKEKNCISIEILVTLLEEHPDNIRVVSESLEILSSNPLNKVCAGDNTKTIIRAMSINCTYTNLYDIMIGITDELSFVKSGKTGKDTAKDLARRIDSERKKADCNPLRRALEFFNISKKREPESVSKFIRKCGIRATAIYMLKWKDNDEVLRCGLELMLVLCEKYNFIDVPEEIISSFAIDVIFYIMKVSNWIVILHYGLRLLKILSSNKDFNEAVWKNDGFGVIFNAACGITSGGINTEATADAISTLSNIVKNIDKKYNSCPIKAGFLEYAEAVIRCAKASSNDKVLFALCNYIGSLAEINVSYKRALVSGGVVGYLLEILKSKKNFVYCASYPLRALYNEKDHDSFADTLEFLKSKEFEGNADVRHTVDVLCDKVKFESNTVQKVFPREKPKSLRKLNRVKGKCSVIGEFTEFISDYVNKLIS